MMDQLNGLLPEAIVEFVIKYLFIVLAVLAVLVLLVIIFIICLAATSAKHKKKVRALEEQHKQNLDYAVQEARTQTEQQVRAKYEQMNGTGYDPELLDRCNQMSAAIDDLNHQVRDKQDKIDSLTAELERAKHVVAKTRSESRESEYAEAIDEWEQANNELEAENAELKRANTELSQKYSVIENENKRLENEIKLRTQSSNTHNDRLLNENIDLTRENAMLKTENERLAAENESLKGAAKPATARTSRRAAADTAAAAKPAAKKSTAKSTSKAAAKPAQKTEPAVADDDDDEDEVYDDFGDDSSVVKVTIKFDRNKGNWIITRSDTNRTYRRVSTKQDALLIGKDLARRLQAQLVVHKKDGKFQKV